jgi:hypothetical protein
MCTEVMCLVFETVYICSKEFYLRSYGLLAALLASHIAWCRIVQILVDNEVEKNWKEAFG